ncbi:MAG TPA: extracellular solute-binding protein [Clostridiales bacterium]|nr:extracellular solute-binding protein [Clostridiales bacterium]
MKNKKRFLAVFVTFLMVVSLLYGCGGKTNDPAPQTSTGSSSDASVSQPADGGEDGPFGKYAEPVTISVVKNLGQSSMEFPEGDSLEDNVWTRYYEDQFNIRFDWKWSTTLEQYDQKVNIAITSGDVPDVMKVNRTQLKMMVDNEQVYDLTELVDKYASDFTKEVLNADDGASLDSATFSGRLMAIPAIVSDLQSANVLWIRTDWLGNLGLDIPETVEDFWTVAEAFATKDPDGNGANDTYALALNKDLFGTGSVYASGEGFFNMYNSYPNIWITKDGKLAYGSIQPEAKDALAALQEMYAKGYMDPEFGVKDANKVNEDVCAGKAGMMFGNFWNMAWVNDAKVADPTVEWVPAAIPGNAKAQLSFGTTSYYVVSKDCKYPEAAFKLLNGYLDKGYGEHAEPLIYNITPEGYGPFDYPVITMEPSMKNFEAAKKVTAALESGDTSGLNAEQMNYYELCKLSLAGDHSNNNWHQLKMFGPGGSLGVVQKYWDNGNVMPDLYYGPPTPAMTEKKSTLDKLQLTDFSVIIMGAPVDDFDKFVANWLNLGGRDMTDEVNEWYANK